MFINNNYNNHILLSYGNKKNYNNDINSIDSNYYGLNAIKNKNKNKNNMFWTKIDTMNMKKTLNLNQYKYPEPLDIDDYLI